MEKIKDIDSKSPILYFDGVCGLCNKSVNFFLKRDKRKKLRYCALQSDYAKNNLSKNYTLKLETVVLTHNARTYTKSQAILASLVFLGFPWSLFGMFLIVPKQATDLIYNFIARNRYKYFGQLASCRIATEEEKELFLD
jgi:predicted DCC family thiol-disulfide oxidoreductase YuxK